MLVKDLIQFLENNYDMEQDILWHTAAQGDVQFYVNTKITDDLWHDYLQDLAQGGSDLYGDVASAIAADYNAYIQFRNETKESN